LTWRPGARRAARGGGYASRGSGNRRAAATLWATTGHRGDFPPNGGWTLEMDRRNSKMLATPRIGDY